MTRFNLIAMIMTAALVTTACGHQQTKFEGAKAFTVSNESGGKGLNATPSWLKHKKNSVDTEVKLINTYNFPIQIKQSSIVLNYGGQKAVMRQRGSFSGEMAPGVMQMVTMIFDMPSNDAKGGKGVVTIDDITKGDGKSKLPALKIDFTVQPL